MNNNKNEPQHSWFSPEPENPEYTRGYQDGTNDGFRMGERKGHDEGIWMVNQFLTYLESKVGKAMIIDIQEKIQEEKEKMRDR